MAEIDYAVKYLQDHRLLLETMIVEIAKTGTVCQIDYRQQR